ncbi:MAG: hypothetical protein ACTSWJ_08065 [Candidatus Heimdallarchaeaceae archaeon]
MKRGSSYLISTILVISMLIGGFGISTGSAYQAVVPGEQLLYEIDYVDRYEGEYQVWYENEPYFDPYYERSHWNTYDDSYVQTELRSYFITGGSVSTAIADQVSTTYDGLNHYSGQDYDYNYPATSWELINSYDYFNEGNYNYSNFFSSNTLNTYDPILNFDPAYIYSAAVYNTTTTVSYTINGVTSPIIVDIYTYNYTSSSSWTQNQYDVSYTIYEDFTSFFTAYIDPATGYMLDLKETIIYDYYGTFGGFSTELGTNLSGHDYSTSTYSKIWKLIGSTLAYGGEVDVEIPALLSYVFDNRIFNTTWMTIPFDILNTGPSVTLEVYLDEKLLDTVYSMSSGYNEYNIFVDDIPFEGPYYGHWIKFVVYDNYNHNLNSTCEFYLVEERTTMPTWGPSWIEGPDYIKIYESDFDSPFYIYSDTNWTVQTYKWDGFVYSYMDYWEGYQNGTMWLYDYGLSEGLHDYLIVFEDNVGCIVDLYVTVEVLSPDTPQISGPTGDFYYWIGDDYTLYWQINDVDPTNYEVKFDGTIIASGIYTDGQTIPFKPKEHIFAPGDYEFSIMANDTMGHENYIHLMINADGSGTVDIYEPTLTPSETTIHMEEGQNVTLKWHIYDENLVNYTVWQNTTEIAFVYSSGSDEDFALELSHLTVGYWFFEIVAFDTYGNGAHGSIEVFVSPDDGVEDNDTESPTDPEEPSNTVSIDAPGVLYTALGFLSVSALVVILKRRK